jgi:hypothetical protein
MSQYPAQPAQPAEPASLCVWQIDARVAAVAQNAQGSAYTGYGYLSTCVYPSQIYPLTGNGAAEGGGEVFGYISCIPISTCSLTVVAYLTWVDQDDPNGQFGGWWSVSATDVLGLSGNWTNVSGTILGHGNSSEAVFTNAQMQTLLRAYSCIVDPQAQNGFTPEPCTARTLFGLSATISDQNDTGESNNLTNGPPTLVCESYDCYLSYNSSAP